MGWVVRREIDRGGGPNNERLQITMNYRTTRILTATLCIAMFAVEASAWGPRAQRAIAMAALQMIRKEFDGAFKANDTSYQRDLRLGAEAGVETLRDSVPLYDDEQTLAAMSHQIQLLREVRMKGAGSHFAYRMGVLGALVSEIMLPYGIPFSEQDEILSERINSDLEDHIHLYSYAPRTRALVAITNTVAYFRSKRNFHPDDLGLIADDYARAGGYDGFLSQAGQAYFRKSIEVVSDAWYTVLTDTADSRAVPPSKRVLAWYYVDEIKYQLKVKKSMVYADRAYREFYRINPDIIDAYIVIGDLYYDHGTPAAMERGVREWKIAQRFTGSARKEASERLTAHYIAEGEGLWAKANSAAAADNDLKDALHSFEEALEYGRTSELAASRITETSNAIHKRQEQYDLQQKFIDNAMVIAKQAEKSRFDKDFSGALESYNYSLNLLAVVDASFKDLQETARQTTNNISKSIKEVINEILDQANAQMEEGNSAVDAKKYDEALRAYSRVATIVSAIPDGASSTNVRRRRQLTDAATSEIKSVRLIQKRNAKSKK